MGECGAREIARLRLARRVLDDPRMIASEREITAFEDPVRGALACAYETSCELLGETIAGWRGSDRSGARLSEAHGDLAHHLAQALPRLARYEHASEAARLLAREAMASAANLLATAHDIGLDEHEQTDALLPIVASTTMLLDALAPYLSPEDRRALARHPSAASGARDGARGATFADEAAVARGAVAFDAAFADEAAVAHATPDDPWGGVAARALPGTTTGPHALQYAASSLAWSAHELVADRRRPAWDVSDLPAPRTLAEFARAIATRGTLARSIAIDLFVAWLLADPQGRPVDAGIALLERRAGFDHAEDREASRALRVQLCAAIRQLRRATGRAEALQAPLPHDLAALSPDAILARAIDPLRGRVDFHASWTAFHVSFAEVSPAQRGYFAISWTVYEVQHGGFWQYFLNSTGMLAPIALDGMRLVGADAAADVLARAMALFPGGPSPERADRIDAIEHVLDGALDRLNLEFYAAVPDLMARVKAYALAHPHELFELTN